MAFGTQYLIGDHGATTGSTVVITVATATSTGDAIIVAASSNGAPGNLVTGVTDTQSNTYVLVTSNTASSNSRGSWAYIALSPTPLTLTGHGGGADQITVTWNGSTNAHGAVAVGCPGVAAAAAVDQTATGNATSAAPQVTSSNPPEWGVECAVAVCAFGNGGSSITWGSGWGLLGTFQPSGSQFTSVASQVISPAGGAGVTASATLGASSAWSMLLLTLLPAVYVAGSATTSTGTTVTVPISTATGSGDTLITVASANGTAVMAGASDSAGNSYTLGPSFSNGAGASVSAAYAAGATALTTSNSVTVTFAASDAHSAVVLGVPGASHVRPADQQASTGGTGTAPSVTSGTLTRTTEICIAMEADASAGGAITWAAGWSPLASVTNSGNQYTAAASMNVSSTAAVTASGIITSAAWSVALLTLVAAPVTAPAIPLRRGVAAQPAPPAGGHGSGRAGTFSGTGPVFRPLSHPPGYGRRDSLSPGRGRGHPGAPVVFVGPGTGPVIWPRHRPARTWPDLARLAPRGHGKGNAGTVGPPLPPAGAAVTGTWTAYRAMATTMVADAPVTGSVDCPISSAGASWLIAFCTLVVPPGFEGGTVGVADDVHGYWQPLGAPNGTSPAGLVQCSIWARPGPGTAYPGNPWPATSHVYVYPAGLPGPVCPAVIAVTVIEVSGMSPWLGTVAPATGYTSGSSLTCDPGTPAASSLLLAVGATNATSFTGTPGAPWQSLTGVSVNEASPVVVTTAPVWQVSSADSPATWSASAFGGQVLAGCMVEVPVSVAAPTQPSADWPYTQLLAGFGSGALTPLDQVTWTDITSRFLAGKDTSISAGTQYELDQLEAGEDDLVLDNNDGALTPANAQSEYAPDVVADVPLQLLMTWQGRTISQFCSPVERWPSSWDPDTLYGLAKVTAADAWSLLTAQLDCTQKQEILLSGPYAYWPCDDAAGATYAQNAAPNNLRTLVVAESKGGRGGATYTFGASPGINPGDPNGAAWEQTGLTSPTQGQGYALACLDSGYPPLTGGITVMGWFLPTPITSYSFTATNASPCVFTASGSAFSQGQAVDLIGGSVPAGFSADTGYYVVNPNGTSFQLAANPGGAAINSTSTGSGTVTSGQVAAQLYLLKGTNAATGDVFAVFIGNKTGYTLGALYMRTYASMSRVSTDTLIDSGKNYLNLTEPVHVAVTLNQGNWTAYVNGVEQAGTTGGTAGMSTVIQWMSYMGSADSFYTGSMLNGSCNHLAVFPGILPAGRLSQIVIAGLPKATSQGVPEPPAQFAGEYPQDRMERLMAYGGWSGPRAISQESTTEMAGITDIQGEQYVLTGGGSLIQGVQGEQASQAITYIYQSDGGQMSVDGNGVVCYLSRGDLYGRRPVFLLGENTGAGEYPYEPSAELGYDKSLLYNEAELTPSTGTGSPVVAANTASIAQHSAFTYDTTVYQYDINQVGDQANWIVNVDGTVEERAQSITVDAGANPANWPFVLGIQPMTVVQVTRRPQTGAPPVTVVCIATQVKKTFDYQAGKATAEIITDSFPEGDVLTSGDPVYGQLTGEYPLGW